MDEETFRNGPQGVMAGGVNPNAGLQRALHASEQCSFGAQNDEKLGKAEQTIPLSITRERRSIAVQLAAQFTDGRTWSAGHIVEIADAIFNYMENGTIPNKGNTND